MDGETPHNRPAPWQRASGLLTAGAHALRLRHPREAIEAVVAGAAGTDAGNLDGVLSELMRLGGRARGGDAWDHIALLFQRLTDAQRDAVMCAGRGRWAESCQRLGTSPSPEHRAAAARVAGWSDEPETIGELPALLGDVDADVARVAGEALVILIARSARGAGLGSEARQAVQTAIAEGVATYDRHRKREALLGALDLLATPAGVKAAPPALRSFLTATDHPAHMSMRSVIRRGGTDGLAARAWVWLAFPAFRTACADRLGAPGMVEDAADVLGLGHLAANPARLEALRRLPRAARGEKTDQGAAGLSALDDDLLESVESAGVKHAPRLVASGLPGSLERFNSLIADPRPIVRLNTSRAASAGGAAHAGVAGVLTDLCFDSSEPVARTALVAMGAEAARSPAARRALAQTCGRLARSPHARVRAMASVMPRAGDAWSPADTRDRVFARRAARIGRDGFIIELRGRIASGPIDGRIAAIRLAEQLGLVDAVDGGLVELITAATDNGTDEPARRDFLRAASAAAGALTRGRTEIAVRGTRAAIGHTDPRVRANALDGLARRARRAEVGGMGAAGTPAGVFAAVWPAVVELKSDAHHRVRASAIRANVLAMAAGVEGGTGGAEKAPGGPAAPVRAMLTDERPMHRIAGLWLSRRLVAEAPRAGVQDLSGTIVAMIDSDPSPEIRVRAHRCASQVMAGTVRDLVRAGVGR